MITNIILFTLLSVTIFYCWIDAMRNKKTKTMNKSTHKTYARNKRTGRFIKNFKSIPQMREDIGLPKYTNI